jgi:hypothetical protein
VPFLGKLLTAVREADPRQTARLLAELDSEHFAAREKASRELARLGESARPALQRALARPGAGLEFRRRVEQVLEKTAAPSKVRLRVLRAVEVLEHAGTPAARQVLRRLSEGIPESRLTQEATASLRRLGQSGP